MVALRGVVVDDVEDDLDVRLVQRADHGFELVDLLSALAAACVFVVRGEITNRVVAPIVAQRPFQQSLVLDELVYGHQLYRRDAKCLQVLDHGRMRKAGICPAQRFRHIRVAARESFDVRFVDDRFVERGVRVTVVAPVEVRIVHHGPENIGGTVGVVDRILVAGVIRVAGWVPEDLSFDRAGVRI